MYAGPTPIGGDDPDRESDHSCSVNPGSPSEPPSPKLEGAHFGISEGSPIKSRPGADQGSGHSNEIPL